MWTKLSHKIIRYRFILVIIIGIITIFMGYKARDIEMSYDLATVVPPDDPDMIELQEFRRLFGEDGNVLAETPPDGGAVPVPDDPNAIVRVDTGSKILGENHD